MRAKVEGAAQFKVESDEGIPNIGNETGLATRFLLPNADDRVLLTSKTLVQSGGAVMTNVNEEDNPVLGTKEIVPVPPAS